MNKQKALSVAPSHIEPGIKKYGGQISEHLHKVIKASGLDYTPYVFTDGRILLVLPNKTAAFLYSSDESLYGSLRLD